MVFCVQWMILAVSYTHLDVYKRQTLCRSLELRNSSILHGEAEAGAGETFFTGTLTELNGGDIAVDSVVLFAKDVLVGSGETVSLTFDLKFSETANNNAQLKALTINDIQYFGE